MSCPDRLSSWKREVSTAFAHLSKAQMLGLMYWSVGIALTGSGGINQISALLAQLLKQKEGTVFQRLREWYLDAQHKPGDHRRELDVTSCFGPLLSWILRLWASNERRLALALDATTLGDRWTVLAVCVVIRGCGIPVARTSDWSPCQRFLASVLGRTLRAFAGSYSCRLAGAGLGRSRALRPLALSGHC